MVKHKGQLLALNQSIIHLALELSSFLLEEVPLVEGKKVEAEGVRIVLFTGFFCLFHSSSP